MAVFLSYFFGFEPNTHWAIYEANQNLKPVSDIPEVLGHFQAELKLPDN